MDNCPTPLSQLPAWNRSAADELVNAATHAFGFVLATVGAMVMVSESGAQGDPLIAFGCGLYLGSLLAVYAMSTLSHSAASPQWKSLFRRLDQGFIYVLIVATYTPLSLAYLHGVFWGSVLARCGSPRWLALWPKCSLPIVPRRFPLCRTSRWDGCRSLPRRSS